MKLIATWREAFRWNSTRVFAFLAAVALMWEQMPLEVKALIPSGWTPYIVAVVAVIGAILRNVKQPEKDLKP